MYCPHCAKDTPANQPYCIHCGGKISVAREAVFRQAKAQVEHEKEQFTARNIRALLVYGVAFFVIGLVLFIVTRNPPQPRMRSAWPAYSPPADDQARSGGATQADTSNSGIPRTLVDMQDVDLLDDIPALAPEAGDDDGGE